MATTIKPYGDHGVVLFATNDGTGSFTGPNGNAGTVRTLTNANFIKSDTFFVGENDELALVVSGVISAGMGSVKVILERQAIDPLNSTFFNPSVIGTTRTDQPAVAASASQTIARADLAGQSVADGIGGGASTETLDVTLLTTDHRASGQCRVIVQATGAPQAGDKIIIAAFTRSRS